MSNAKYSPAPWVAYGPTRGEGLTFTNEAHVGPGEGNDICGPIAAVGGDDKEQAMANAHLIAAAPDLLEACENIEQFGASRYEDLGIGRMVRAAIAKAKGGA